MPVAKKLFPTKWFAQQALTLVDHQDHALEDVDVLALFTEWKQFRNPDFIQVKSLMKGNLILDGRNQYNPQILRDLGFIYLGIGR